MKAGVLCYKNAILKNQTGLYKKKSTPQVNFKHHRLVCMFNITCRTERCIVTRKDSILDLNVHVILKH